ncbi:unnamed protein product, partial [Prorocentrum cordatum]
PGGSFDPPEPGSLQPGGGSGPPGARSPSSDTTDEVLTGKSATNRETILDAGDTSGDVEGVIRAKTGKALDNITTIDRSVCEKSGLQFVPSSAPAPTSSSGTFTGSSADIGECVITHATADAGPDASTAADAGPDTGASHHAGDDDSVGRGDRDHGSGGHRGGDDGSGSRGGTSGEVKGHDGEDDDGSAAGRAVGLERDQQWQRHQRTSARHLTPTSVSLRC